MQGRGLLCSSDKLSVARHCKMLTAALSFFGFSSDLIKWRPLLRSDSLEGQRLCWKCTILSFIHSLFFIFSWKGFLRDWWHKALCARTLLLLCSDLTQTELSAHAKPHKNNNRVEWVPGGRAEFANEWSMNTTGSYYPYVGICTAFNAELNVSDHI